MLTVNNSERQKEEMIRELGIYELRGVARELGIKSPTTKKREELIEGILEIASSGEQFMPQPKEIHKGRPFKKLSAIQKLTDSVTKEWGIGLPKVDYQSLMTFAQEIPDFENMTDTISVFKGYVTVNDEYASFLDYQKGNWVFIRKILKNCKKLRTGDYVVVEANSLENKGQFVAIKIISINGVDAEVYQAKVVENGEVVLPTQRMLIKDKNIYIGRRNAVRLDEDVYENDKLQLLADRCQAEGYKLIVLAVDTSFENETALKSIKNIENFSTGFGSDVKLSYTKFVDAVNRCENLLSSGEKVIFFVTDIMQSVNVVNACFREKAENVEKETNVMTHKLLSLGKTYENGVSCTLIICYSPYDGAERFVVNNVLKISKII